MKRTKIQEAIDHIVMVRKGAKINCDIYMEQVCTTVLEALVEKREREKNPPLTLEELREMDGEPVWWWNTSSKPVCTICSFKRMRKNPVFINFDFTDQDCTDITKYEYFRRCGYKAYRRKPEEGAT